MIKKYYMIEKFIYIVQGNDKEAFKLKKCINRNHKFITSNVILGTYSMVAYAYTIDVTLHTITEIQY